jgi:TM2 domain-containing membrane protein YozV
MSEKGSTSNVIAGLASFFLPGLGQLVQGRMFKAAFHCIIFIPLWFIWLGWIMHIWSAYEAAIYQEK